MRFVCTLNCLHFRSIESGLSIKAFQILFWAKSVSPDEIQQDLRPNLRQVAQKFRIVQAAMIKSKWIYESWLVWSFECSASAVRLIERRIGSASQKLVWQPFNWLRKSAGSLPLLINVLSKILLRFPRWKWFQTEILPHSVSSKTWITKMIKKLRWLARRLIAARLANKTWIIKEAKNKKW